ncbi:hypothetical protein HD806DRAFT_547204 [Xylariaceae sp. AK1471]|nr:hypothetical protein HD806DRAFT_547204 [Xylariaceae sp. AK1471]
MHNLRTRPKLLTGWRRTAALNTILLIVVTLIFTGILAASSIRAGSLTKALIYSRGCNGGSATRVSVALRLLINIFSTAFLASLNYYMQILNAPSREEIDVQHSKGIHHDIGVPSWSNAFRLFWFKSITWMILLLSSIPIHFLFNSTTFEIDYRTANYNLTIASKGLIYGASSLPGPAFRGFP